MVLPTKHKKHNPSWSQTPDNSYKVLTIGSSGFGKTNTLFILISHPPDIDKIYLYVKDPFEAKYKCLPNKGEST